LGNICCKCLCWNNGGRHGSSVFDNVSHSWLVTSVRITAPIVDLAVTVLSVLSFFSHMVPWVEWVQTLAVIWMQGIFWCQCSKNQWDALLIQYWIVTEQLRVETWSSTLQVVSLEVVLKALMMLEYFCLSSWKHDCSYKGQWYRYFLQFKWVIDFILVEWLL
jgi:hypothetical protein